MAELTPEERAAKFLESTGLHYHLANEFRSLMDERDRFRFACRAVVEQLSPSIVDVVIKPGVEPFAVRLAREALEASPNA